jgi:hypothetical protein
VFLVPLDKLPGIEAVTWLDCDLAADHSMPLRDVGFGRELLAVDMTSGRQVLVERSRDFILVPWRAVMERHIGKSVSDIMREGGIGWTFGRQRSGPVIS